MAHDPSTELRNAAQKRTGVNRKDPLKFETFIAEWPSALRRKGKEWEGSPAVAELKHKEMFQVLLSADTAWKAEDLLTRVIGEMRAYRQEAGSRLVKEYFDDIDEFLRAEGRRVQKAEDRASIPDLKFLLKDLRKEVERARRSVRWLKDRRREWHFGIWPQFWPEIPRKNLVSRKIELDTRLQVELGKMFADYLRPRGVSLETIARLILLAYWVGGLSEVKEHGSQTRYTGGRVLTVRNIRENLRNAGLHKAMSFQEGRN